MHYKYFCKCTKICTFFIKNVGVLLHCEKRTSPKNVVATYEREVCTGTLRVRAEHTIYGHTVSLYIPVATTPLKIVIFRFLFQKNAYLCGLKKIRTMFITILILIL